MRAAARTGGRACCRGRSRPASARSSGTARTPPSTPSAAEARAPLRIRQARRGGSFVALSVALPGGVPTELCQRFQHELAFVEARMGHLEPGLVDQLVAVEQKVEVDRPRAARRTVTRPAELGLDLEQAVEQRARRK